MIFDSLRVDVWMHLHKRRVSIILRFKKMAMACKQKFNGLYKQYINDKVVNNILEHD